MPWFSDPGPVDAFKGLLNCQDDNSYYAAVKGFAQYVSNVQISFEQSCKDIFGSVPLRVQNLTQETADWYNSTGCQGATKGPDCVLENVKVLNPNLSQFQIYCINNCVDPDAVQSGSWEKAGDAIKQTYKELFEKFLEGYPT